MRKKEADRDWMAFEGGGTEGRIRQSMTNDLCPCAPEFLGQLSASVLASSALSLVKDACQRTNSQLFACSAAVFKNWPDGRLCEPSGKRRHKDAPE